MAAPYLYPIFVYAVPGLRDTPLVFTYLEYGSRLVLGAHILVQRWRGWESCCSIPGRGKVHHFAGAYAVHQSGGRRFSIMKASREDWGPA